MQETATIIRNINRLSSAQQLLIAEQIMRSVHQKEQLQMKKAVELLYTDYLTDKELTTFTQLDHEDFYETR
jgi:hypothetical protein